MHQPQNPTTNWSDTASDLLAWGFQKLTSRKFWAAAITAYALWQQGHYEAAGAVVAAYIGIEGARDIIQTWGQSKANAQQAAAAALAQAAPQPTQPPPQQPPIQPTEPPAVQPAQVEPKTPWDVGAFHDKVLAKVEARYTVSNPATVFYTARDAGANEPAADLYQVRDFYLYLHDLQRSAHEYIEEQTKATGPCATESKALWLIRQDGYRLLDTISDLQNLIQANIPWKTSIPPMARYMTRIGNATNELMQTYFPPS